MYYRLLLFLLAGACLLPAAAAPVWECDFTRPEIREAVRKSPCASLKKGADGVWTLVLDAPAGRSGAVTVPLPAGKLAGKYVTFEAEIAYRNVTYPVGAPWNGVKFMASFLNGEGRRVYPQWDGFPQAERWGRHDRRRAYWRYAYPADAKDCELTLGLETSSGYAEFRNVRFFTEEAPVSILTLSPVPKARYDAVLPPRGRGVMSPFSIDRMDEDAFRTLADWKVNLLRWQLNQPQGKGDPASYAAWVREQYSVLDRLFEMGEKYGIWIVVDLHLASSILQTADGRDTVVEIWRGLARHCKGKPMLWGYDLLNEPNTASSEPGLEMFAEYQGRLVRAVREIDPDTQVIVTGHYGSHGGLEFLPVYPEKNIVYTIHFYRPNEFTHQLDRRAGTFVRYPDANRNWDKRYLRRMLAGTREFQLKTGARIYVGEFSAIRWAPGADRYLRDSLELFEEYGWDWSYHAFREWDGWSLEHSDDPAGIRLDPENGRLRAVLEALRRER